MGLLSKLRGETPKETPCPRCGVPAPDGSARCNACGWNLSEPYTGDAGAPTGGVGDSPRGE